MPIKLTKTATVQIEFDESTHWLCRDQELSDFLKLITGNVVTSVTSGNVPRITVTLDPPNKAVAARAHHRALDP